MPQCCYNIVHRFSGVMLCRCEQVLTACVSVRNCLKLYQVSEEQHANQLKSYCLQVISNHWVSLRVCACACVSMNVSILYNNDVV